MSHTGPLTAETDAPDPQYRRSTPRGVLATVALLVAGLTAVVAPAAVAGLALATATGAGVVTGRRWSRRRRSRQQARLCLPGTDVCVRV